MRPYIFIFILVLLGFFGEESIAQDYLFDAQSITTEDGLANLTTSAIHQDKNGFIWIGTKYGLNRYDGYEFKLFDKNKNNLTLNTRISAIAEDDKGKLWLTIEKDNESILYDIFDTQTEQAIPLELYFKDLLPFPNHDLYAVGQLSTQHTIWLTTKSGQLYFYQKGQFKKIATGLPSSINLLAGDDEGDYWLGGAKDLLSINSKGAVQEILSLSSEVARLWIGENNKIWVNLTVEKDEYISSSTIWSKEKGVAHLEPFPFVKDKEKLKLHEPIFRSKSGLWYVQKYRHLHVFDENGEWLSVLHNDTGDKLKAYIIACLDLGEEVWFTSSNGLLKTSARKPFFYLVQDNSISTEYRGITEDEQGNIYFLNTYLCRWNPIDNKVHEMRTSQQGTFGILYTDSILWKGIYRDDVLGVQTDLRTNEDIIYPALYGRYAYSILPSSTPEKYLVGHEGGLSYIDLNQQQTLPFEGFNGFEELKSSSVFHLHQNTAGIWLATDKGLFLMTEKEGIIQRFDKASGHLPYTNIVHIHEDESGVFWLATLGGGLIRWDPVRNSKIPSFGMQYTTQDGMSHNVLYAVYGDDYGYLWASSDRGLMQIDKNTFDVRTYTTKDGLFHNEFNRTSHHQSKDGTLYFGGLGGLIRFHPRELAKKITSQTPLKITSCQLLKEDETNMTDQTDLVRSSHEIIITPSDKMLELKFAVLDFDDPKNHLYAYQLEGYNSYWNTIRENYIQIMHLPYGKYTLKIKGQNINKGWSKQEISLDVRVLKPFYLEWWFVSLAALSLVGLFVIVVKKRETNLKKNQERIEEEVQKRTQKIGEDKKLIESQAGALKQLDKAKTRFFFNVTHEFRTPLTLIMGPLNQVLENPPPPKILKRRLKGVRNNAQHLMTLINQMLDISKIESGRMHTQVTRGDIVEYTQSLVERFEEILKQKAQHFSFVTNIKKWETNFDSDKWNKIIYNLLSNAIKYTPVGERIQMSLMRTTYQGTTAIRLDVKDTGPGIRKEQLDKVFNRFYQVDDSSIRAQDGTGIGLALVKELVELQGGEIRVSSQLERGTTFELYLPVLTAENSRTEPVLITTAEPIIGSNDGETLEKASNLVNPHGEKLALLLIEDNEEIREYIRTCLDADQYDITEAVDGEDGLAKAQSLVPDLIISDVMMPKKDGFEVVSAIRQHLVTSHIPVVLLTAKASLESRLEGLQRGADAYLTKPFSPRELKLRIKKLIETRQQLRARYQNNTIENSGDKTYQQEDQFIIELRSYILGNLDQDKLNGDVIGQHFGMSRVHLYRKLKALTDQSISAFVKQVRLEKAKELLIEGKLNISEITYQTGFSSISYFSRSFKKAYGKAPSEV